MSQAIANSTVDWPKLDFGPINLWSFPAAWKREPVEARPAQLFVAKDTLASQVNPLVRRLLAYR